MQISYFPGSKSVVHLLVDAISSLFLDQWLTPTVMIAAEINTGLQDRKVRFEITKKLTV